MAQATDYLSLPSIDPRLLQEALATASRKALPSPTPSALKEAALELWRRAHQARRDAMYARGRQ